MFGPNQVPLTVKAEATFTTRKLEQPAGNASQRQAHREMYVGSALEFQRQFGEIIGSDIAFHSLGIFTSFYKGLKSSTHIFDRPEHPLNVIDYVRTSGTEHPASTGRLRPPTIWPCREPWSVQHEVGAHMQ